MLTRFGTVSKEGGSSPFFYLGRWEVWVGLVDVCPDLLKGCGPSLGPIFLTIRPFPYRFNDIFPLYLARMSASAPYEPYSHLIPF